MIDHTGLNVSDYKKSKLFYESALKPIGYKALKEIPTEYTGGVGVCGFGEPPKPDFWITEGPPNKPAIHIAFRVDSRKKVDEFYLAAIAAGGKDNGKPGLRPHYSDNYYGAFVLDPDGHNIEAVFHG
jgi:catechol 2,3-dioxygenase-like lactoylglutathione lyase family enzyme